MSLSYSTFELLQEAIGDNPIEVLHVQRMRYSGGIMDCITINHNFHVRIDNMWTKKWTKKWKKKSDKEFRLWASKQLNKRSDEFYNMIRFESVLVDKNKH